MSVNTYAGEPPHNPLPPFLAARTTAQPRRDYCPFLRFGCHVVFDGCQWSTIARKDEREPTRRAVRALLHSCNIFAPTPTNSIKFPVYGSLFLAPFRNSQHRFCYPQAIQSIRWRLYSMSNRRAAAESSAKAKQHTRHSAECAVFVSCYDFEF